MRKGGVGLEKSVFVAAAAGLLHDIGKFASRAGEKPRGGWEQAKREAGYAHAQMSWEVVQEIVPASLHTNELRAILYHHHLAGATKENEVDPVLAYRLALADWLSSGEREEEEGEGAGVPYVRSPFSRLGGYDVERYYPALQLGELTVDNAVPAPKPPKPAKEEFGRLWQSFLKQAEEHLEVMKSGEEDAFLEALYALLQEYTWCVPSAYAKHVSDVSLFDHARTTAALAVCLTVDGRDEKWCKEVMDALKLKEKEESDAPPALERETALLVGGDISGVQKFIYTITSSGAAKSLRGRSFYLQLLTEAAARYILRELGLPVTNIIYLGGGNFFLLAPMSAGERLPAIQREVSSRLLKAHEGGLHLALGWSPVPAGEFRVGEFHNAWQSMHHAIGRAKARPLAHLADETLKDYLGQGMGVGGDADKTCSVCGAEFEKPARTDVSGAETVRLCRMCAGFEELGSELARAKWLASAHFAPQALPAAVEDWHTVLQSFGMDFWAVEDLRQVVVKAKPAILILTPVEETDWTKETRRIEGVTQVEAFRFFPQLVPLKASKEQPDRQVICTFDELCEASTGGFKRWGVLRMDVDNLGKLFREGFVWKDSQNKEVNHLTLSRVASLSFALRLFFEKLLPDFAGAGEYAERMKNRLYLQYAGGDDVFVVGSWDALPHFAMAVRERFRRFACENPHVTVSAGIALAPEKYPLYQAADDAGSAEERAKGWVRDGKKKDAFHFLGFTTEWENAVEARRWAERFTQWCTAEPPKAPKALVQMLLNLYVGYAEERGEAVRQGRCDASQVYFGPWMWRLAYYMARRRSDSHMPEEVKRELEELEERMVADPRQMDIVGLAARWAHYLAR